MACIIAAPTSNTGKTILSLILTAWVRNKGKTIQPFKVGPDYLDPQQLSFVAKRQCRNLDIILGGTDWVKESFYRHGSSADFAIIEGVMGLFDGLGSSEKGSTADLAIILNLPVVLIVDASGQAASLGALVRGFREQNKGVKIVGVVLNNVNTKRHKDLLSDVLNKIEVPLLGTIPTQSQLKLSSGNLGLIPPDTKNLGKDQIDSWSRIAESYLDIDTFRKLLKAPKYSDQFFNMISPELGQSENKSIYPIAMAQDEAFHFRYPETKEYLEALNMPIIEWRPIEDEVIPQEARGLIIPGGFPERFAQIISESIQSLNSLKSFFGNHPIYAECGGMLLLGQSLKNADGEIYPMAKILPFHAELGELQVGYRTIRSLRNSLILESDDKLIGHEFHRWSIKEANIPPINGKELKSNDFQQPWEIKDWNSSKRKEGWSNKLLHASWIHLHWPTSRKVMNLWKKSVQINN